VLSLDIKLKVDSSGSCSCYTKLSRRLLVNADARVRSLVGSQEQRLQFPLSCNSKVLHYQAGCVLKIYHERLSCSNIYMSALSVVSTYRGSNPEVARKDSQTCTERLVRKRHLRNPVLTDLTNRKAVIFTQCEYCN
jgi:hypothetical protein